MPQKVSNTMAKNWTSLLAQAEKADTLASFLKAKKITPAQYYYHRNKAKGSKRAVSRSPRKVTVATMREEIIARVVEQLVRSFSS